MVARARIAVLSLLALLAAGTVPRAAEHEVFSRTRWIAERAQRARFDGGLLAARPEMREAVAASREERAQARTAEGAAPQRRRPIPTGPPNLRVSADILEPDTHSGAQAETEAEPHLAADPEDENRLVAGYQEDRFEDGGARALTFAASSDGGKHWSEGLVPGLTPVTGGAFERASDPWVAFGPGGRAYYAAIAFNETNPDNAVTLSSSEDGGNSWGPPVVVHINHSRDFDDKEAVVADAVPGSPFSGRVYVAWDTVAADGRQILRLAHSADGGASFSAPVDVWSRGQNLGALPLVGPGGLVYIVWMSFLPGSTEILAARSDDGGVSWNTPVVVALPQTRGVPQLRTGELVAATIDTRRGTLYVVWPDDRFTPGTDQIVLARSGDGDNWSDPVRVSDGPDNAPSFTPAVAVTGQGRFGVAYSTLRNDPSRSFLVDQYLVTTNSRGRLLGATRTSTRSFDVRDAAFALGYFLGDYQGLVAGQRTFRQLWVATYEESQLREGRQPDVVTLKVR